MISLQNLTAPEANRKADALLMLAHGSPLEGTLEAAAILVANLQQDVGCAILLTDDYRLSLQAVHGLSEGEERQLRASCRLPYDECLAALQQESQAELHLLLTSSAEVVGAVVVFHLRQEPRDPAVALRLREVCAIVTLAVEGKHLIDELYFAAHHDTLTQTRNRLWMERELASAVRQGAEAGSCTGLLLLGIDSFRTINELLGSQVGNDLLRAVAARLSNALHPSWSLARCSGDEFMVLLRHLDGADQVNSCAAAILNTFQDSFELGDHELLVRASLGTSFCGPGECSGEDLQNWADLALRYGKHSARGRITHFERSMMATPPERLELERHLRFAMQKRELELFYQPQIQLSTGRLLAVEALLRWRHPSLGFISPAAFVPVAEQIGIIDEIGSWVLEEAIRQLGVWHRQGLPHLRVAVNVSALQYSRQDFASEIAKALRNSTIRPSDLELEITESAVMTNFQHGVRQMKLLRALGVATALDDFGTGHSSLAYLQELPIQRIKIDRMFVKDVATSNGHHPLLAGIIRMGRALGFDLIAEGVETIEQAQAVCAMGCDEVQGFFFSKPLPALEVLGWAQARASCGSTLLGEGPQGSLAEAWPAIR